MVHSTMNHMKKQEQTDFKDIRGLSRAVGDFIHYWGFRKIHGEIWTQLYLSQKALSGADLVKRLKVSKALVSPALKQLQQYKLIKSVKGKDSREKLFEANPDFLSIIKNVLETREVPMLAKVQFQFFKLQAASENSEKISQNISPQRLNEMGKMINQAVLVLSVLAKMESFDELEALAALCKKVE
jgi:DNA-binding transcriptional regulator GbsR (MarR family)